MPVIRLTREHARFTGRKSQPLTAGYDVILIVTAHDEYRSFDFSAFPIAVVDTRNCVQKRPKLYYRS